LDKMEGLLALGNFRSDERVALDVIAREARLPCRVVATAGEAAVWLDAHAPVALLVDIATPGAEKVFVKVRSKRTLATGLAGRANQYSQSRHAHEQPDRLLGGPLYYARGRGCLERTAGVHRHDARFVPGAARFYGEGHE
jgi:hypothetical protein